jgi:hypothetical protein
VALGIVAVMVGLVAVAAFFLGSQGQQQPEALGFVPADSVLVVELRPDLPGDQRQAFGTILGHFPGFADQSNLPDKIDQALDQLVQQATDGKRRYIGDLKPYVAGPVYVALPKASAASATSGSSPDHGLAVLTTDGSTNVSCAGLEDGAAVTTERHRDVDIRVRSADTKNLACAMSDRFVLLGDVATIKAALDSRADGNGIAANARFTAATKATPGEHLAWAFLDVPALVGTIGAASPAGLPSPFPTGPLPEWMAFEVRATSGGPIVESVMPDPRLASSSNASPGTNRTPRPDAVSEIAPYLPGSTVALFEVHDLGGLIESSIDQLRQTPEAAEIASQIDAALALVGGPDGLLGPIDQAAVAITLEAGKPGGGIVLEMSDGDAAKGRVEQLTTLLTLAGLSGAITEDYGGTRLLKLPLGEILELAGSAVPGGSLPGGGLPGGGLPGGGLPGGAEIPADLAGQNLVLAAHQGLLVAGLGDTFVKAVIDASPGSSLADDGAYKTAMDLAGNSNSGQVYVEVQDLLALIVPNLSGTDAATFDREVRPYLAPIAAVASAATSRDGLIRSKIVVSIP